MKESIRNTKSKDELSENSKGVFFCVYIKWLKSLKKHGNKMV